MNDLDQYFGGDVSTSSTGDVQAVSGPEKCKQRILRRLLTNPGDYIFHPEYGAGLPEHVGSVVDAPGIAALVRGQVLLEDAVARSPTPVVSVMEFNGGIQVDIQYNDSTTQAAQFLSFSVSK